MSYTRASKPYMKIHYGVNNVIKITDKQFVVFPYFVVQVDKFNLNFLLRKFIMFFLFIILHLEVYLVLANYNGKGE